MTKFIGIKACVFDAYGTLFDVHSAVGKHRPRLGDNADAVSGMWRAKQLEYTWQRTILDRYVDFWRVTADGLDYALDAHGVDDAALRDDLLGAYLELDCYPEVPEVLGTLREAGLRNAVLSNGSPMMLEAAVDNAGNRRRCWMPSSRSTSWACTSRRPTSTSSPWTSWRSGAGR